jgi:transposase
VVSERAESLVNRGRQHFLDDPLVPITSNKIEGLLRTVVLGRVNALGSRSERGIKTAETFYTLIETAKLNGVDPGVYLQAAALAALRGETVPLPDEIA